MTDEELRQIVRGAIERHLGRRPEPPSTPARQDQPVAVHVSHLRFTIASGSDLDGPCLIEPGVPCVHCGYCQSYGH